MHYRTVYAEFQLEINNKTTQCSVLPSGHEELWNLKPMENAQMAVRVKFNATSCQYKFITLHQSAFPSTTAWH
jgi:hypothetical protein